MAKSIVLYLTISFIVIFTSKAQETTIYSSPHTYKETVDKMYKTLQNKGLINKHFKIDYYSEDSTALKVKMTTFEFSDAYYINQIVACEPTAALDMPFRVIVWQEDVDVFIAYIDPIWLKRRFMLQSCGDALANYTDILIRVVNETIKTD